MAYCINIPEEDNGKRWTIHKEDFNKVIILISSFRYVEFEGIQDAESNWEQFTIIETLSTYFKIIKA